MFPDFRNSESDDAAEARAADALEPAIAPLEPLSDATEAAVPAAATEAVVEPTAPVIVPTELVADEPDHFADAIDAPEPSGRRRSFAALRVPGLRLRRSNGAETERTDVAEIADVPARRRSFAALRGPALRVPTIRRSNGRSKPAGVCGLHLEQGEAIAVVARFDAGVLEVQRAAAVDLPVGAVRDGEVADAEALGVALKRLFAEHGLPKRVRIGISNQRTIMRTIDLPPLEREAEIAAAVRMHAPDHIAMPLDQAVMDFQVLGRVDTPDGPRTRVVIVATDRESVDRMVEATRRAGLRPEGIDLTAFALIRALRAGVEAKGSVLYAHVAGTTTMAIAEGDDCRFTRVSPAGFDTFASQLAERAEISVDEARHRLVAAGADGLSDDAVARTVVAAGAGALADDLRTSIEFFASQWGGTVEEIVLTGTALAVPGFAAAVEKSVGLPVRPGLVEGSAEALGGLETWRVAVAAGLSVEEVAA